MNSRIRLFLLCCAGFLGIACPRLSAQWLIQNFQLNPGWNAIRLHVDASHDTIANLLGAGGTAITEVWAWQPGGATGGIIASPSQPVSGSDWVRWSRTGTPSTSFPLLANTSYLVRNSGSTAYTWSIKGKAVPPSLTWAASGLNFIGFPTVPSGAPNLYNFLNPSGSISDYSVYAYPGNEASGASPITSQVFSFSGQTVTRGQAFWISRGLSDNRYFGPLSVSLSQDYRGILFGQNTGTYTFRLRNELTSTNRVSLTLISSEPSPTGTAFSLPPLLLRTDRNITTLLYSYTNLPVGTDRTFGLAPKGQPGSEIDVVLGLDRASMTGVAGTQYAGILRIKDTTLGQLQVDLPVTATQASTGGLWVGNASVNQVGNYLKTYAQATNEVDFNNQSASLTALAGASASADYASSAWSGVQSGLALSSVATSADGTQVLIGPADGRPSGSVDRGVNWVSKTSLPPGNWPAVASSADGTLQWAAYVNNGPTSYLTNRNRGVNGEWKLYMSDDSTQGREIAAIATSYDGTVLVVGRNGSPLVRSTDSGATWTPISQWQNRAALAMSANGNRIVEAYTGSANLFVSSDSGGTWSWRGLSKTYTGVACSDDGTKMAACTSDGYIYTSADSGSTWSQRYYVSTNSFTSIAITSDGTKILAGASNGTLLLSVDSGGSFAAKLTTGTWRSVACTSDGTYMAAADGAGYLWISINSGANWNNRGHLATWKSVSIISTGTGASANASLVASTGTHTFNSVSYTGALYRLADVKNSTTGTAFSQISPNTAWTCVVQPGLNGGSTLYAAQSNLNQLFRTTNTGSSWSNTYVDGSRIGSWGIEIDTLNPATSVTQTLTYTNTTALYVAANAGNASTYPSTIAVSGVTNRVTAMRVKLNNLTAMESWDLDIHLQAPTARYSTLLSDVGGASPTYGTSTKVTGEVTYYSYTAQSFTFSDAASMSFPTSGGLAPGSYLPTDTDFQSAAESAPASGLTKVTTLTALLNDAVPEFGIYRSTDSGSTWALTTAPSGSWQALACSSDGLRIVAATTGSGGGIYRSADGGTNWTACTTPVTASSQSWRAVTSSADGQRVFAALEGGAVYQTIDFGVTWAALVGAPTGSWRSLATTANGQWVVGVMDGGGLYVSSDGGNAWDLRANAPTAAAWVSVSCSTNGNAIVGLVNGGQAYVSSNAGVAWAVVAGSQPWTDVAMSADGTTVYGATTSATSSLMRLTGTATGGITWDPVSGRVLVNGTKYLQASFDSALGSVPAAFPLRLIVHQDASGVSRLLRRVFIGPDANTNTVLTLQQSVLNQGLLAQARRVTAVHLPITTAGQWTFTGTFGGTGILQTGLTNSFDNAASNPFVHAYHPDHDNLDALYQSLPRGAESYDIQRHITLSFTPPGTDFVSRTVGGTRVQGVYLENIVLKGGNNQTRTIVTQGTFILNRISDIATLQ